MVAGIEKEAVLPPIARCSQLAGDDGEEIVDLEDYRTTQPTYITMSIFNVNLWAIPMDPTSLTKSIEWFHVDWPVETLSHAPACVAVFSQLEKKEIAVCFESKGAAKMWVDTAEKFKHCREEGEFPKDVGCPEEGDGGENNDGSDECHPCLPSMEEGKFYVTPPTL